MLRRRRLEVYLSKIRVGKRVLRSDPLVRVNLQHLLQQVDGHRVGSLKHDLEILGLHFRKRVDVVLGLEKLLYSPCNEDWSYLNTGDLLHGLLCWSPAEGQYPGELVNVCRAEFYLSVRREDTYDQFLGRASSLSTSPP